MAAMCSGTNLTPQSILFSSGKDNASALCCLWGKSGAPGGICQLEALLPVRYKITTWLQKTVADILGQEKSHSSLNMWIVHVYPVA